LAVTLHPSPTRLYHSTLSVENLAAERGGWPLFSGVSFGLHPGEALQLTGPNGTGKTTLLRIIAGLVRQSYGTMVRGGERPGIQLHYLAHANAMKPQMSVRQNLAFWAKFQSGQSIDMAIIDQALTTIGLGRLADLPFLVLSSGQKRRTAFARLLITPAPLWLLDEPNAGLDAAASEVLESLIDQHRAKGGIVIAATHQTLSSNGSAHLPDWQSLSLGDFVSAQGAHL
jgi:heme exporter protein A